MVRGMKLGEGRTATVTAVLAAITLATAALSLVGCAPEPVPEPEPELLTISDAGGRYLDAVCPINERWDVLDVEVDRLRITVARGSSDASSSDTRLFTQAVTALEKKIVAAEEVFGDTTVEWPEGSKRAIEAVQASLASDAEQARLVADMNATEIAEYTWEGADRVASAAQEARAALGLPEDPQVACDLRLTSSN